MEIPRENETQEAWEGRSAALDSLADLSAPVAARPLLLPPDSSRKLYGFREGDVCEALNKEIADLIIFPGPYIVFLDAECYVQWCIYDSAKVKYPKRYSAIMNRVSFLETISASHFKPEVSMNGQGGQLRQFRRLLGEAVARTFDGDGESADLMLDQAERLLRDRSEERARFWYLCAATVATMVLIVVGGLLWLWRTEVRQSFGVASFHVLLGASLGGLGALVSTVMRVRQVNLNASSGPLIHWVESVARIAVGAAGALLIALAIKGHFILGRVNPQEKESVALACLLIVCFLSGACERIVPNLIRPVEATFRFKERVPEEKE